MLACAHRFGFFSQTNAAYYPDTRLQRILGGFDSVAAWLDDSEDATAPLYATVDEAV